MKHNRSSISAFVILLITSVLLFGACSTKSTTEPGTDGSYLIITPDTLVLQKTDSMKNVEFKMSCGCGFTLQIESITQIPTEQVNFKYIPAEPMTENASRHHISYSFEPSTAPSGITQYIIHFVATKGRATYTGDLFVRIEN